MAQSDEIRAAREDGVWIFSYRPSGWGDALHSGQATIRGECLFVAEAVVVWPETLLARAEAAVSAAKTGRTETFRIGGGGISLDEGDTPIPAVVAERCEAREVWFGAPQ
jgi:hypothetical protein